jgi:pilus assembly protein CpaC
LVSVAVTPNVEPIRQLMRDGFPGESIDVFSTKESMILVGNVSSAAIAERALALANTAVKGAVSNLQIAPPPADKQILLKVRFAELNRTASTEFAVNLVSTGALNTPGSVTTGQFPGARTSRLNRGITPEFSLSDVLNIFAFRPDLDLAVFMKALQSRGLLQILAEPNLVTTAGKEASFLAGGEFPVPVAQGGANAGAITVQFKQFGIQIAFLPQVTHHGTVKMHVKPEVSSIDPSSGVQLSGFNIPALSTRRVETDIELEPGQSFAIAGLIDDRIAENLSRIPGLSSIPLLGEIFKSRAEEKSRNELVVIVTPELASPGMRLPQPVMPKPFLQEDKKDPGRNEAAAKKEEEK